jgi:hypothetical protein
MAAAEAGRRGRRVIVIDHWRRLGERIRISGGGRCNFTNRTAGAEHYLCGNRHFPRSALARYSPADFIALLDRHGVSYEERDHGQMFCRHSAEDVTRILMDEANRAGVRWMVPGRVGAVDPVPGAAQAGARFCVGTSEGTLRCASVVVATGGLACPRIGASPLGYDVARRFGLRVIDPCPALVPLTLSPVEFAPLAPLAGVAFTCEARCVEEPRAPRFVERALITHRALSGPAILQVSSYWQQASADLDRPASVSLDLAPGCDLTGALVDARRTRQALATTLGMWLPRRLAQHVCAARGWPQWTSDLSNAVVADIERHLRSWTFVPAGTLGFDKAEVTLGGVDTRQLSSQTMETTAVPGLHFVGEVVDVTGWLGGYNFQWAWASGWVAGQHA